MTSMTWHAAPASTIPNGDFSDALYEFFVPLEAATLTERLNPLLVPKHTDVCAAQ
ncbi:MAG TPA: hypothetical protein VFV48_03050 [Pseudomonadales bacterium]|nr:hypothetical protein [Pseudomonadales bacterium]